MASFGQLLDTQEPAANDWYTANRASDTLANIALHAYSDVFPTPLDFKRRRYGINFIEGRHLEVMNDYAMRLHRGEIENLIVTMPPQHGKSDFWSIDFPTWWASKHQRDPILLVSYSGDYARSFSRSVRDQILEFGPELGVMVRPGTSESRWWYTTAGASMASGGFDGQLAGKPAKLVIIDDPHKSKDEAESLSKTTHVWSIYTSIILGRQHPGARKIIVTTRMSLLDLVERVKEAGEEWTILNLPAIAREKDDACGREIGDPLWPESGRDVEWYMGQRAGMTDETVWNALWQQIPGRVKLISDQPPLIAQRDLLASIGREIVCSEQAPVDLGLDVARSERTKGDASCLCAALPHHVKEMEKFYAPNTTQTVGKAIAWIERHKARSIRIDDTGIGGGVTDLIREKQKSRDASHYLKRCQVFAFQFGATAFDETRYANLRTELYFNVRNRIAEERECLPDDNELIEELGAPIAVETSDNRQRLESKASIRKRLHRSPDKADAYCLAKYPDDWITRVGVL